MGDEPLSDLEIREQSLAGVRDALAALQQVPAAGLDAEKHDTLRDMIDDATALERACRTKPTNYETVIPNERRNPCRT